MVNSANSALTVGQTLLCATAKRVWRPASDCGLPTGADKARWLANSIVTLWEELDRPCSEKTIQNAPACARRREQAHRDERSVLVHGDVHQLNALESGDGFKLVDPDGLLAEAEYDLGVLQGAQLRHRFNRLTCHRGYVLEVSVVVQHRQLGTFGDSG